MTKKLLATDDEEQYEEMMQELIEHQKNEPEKLKLPCVCLENSTIGALLESLYENRANGLLSSSEGEVLLNSGVLSATGFLNSIWSGDDITVDRKTTASFVLHDARLTVHIMAQPSAVTRFLDKKELRGNGFLSRFIVCYPTSKSGQDRE